MSLPRDTKLSYAPQEPALQRHQRRIIRWSFAAVFVIAFLLAAGPIWRKAQMLYYQRLCLNFSSPPLSANDGDWRWQQYGRFLPTPRGQRVRFLGQRLRPDGTERLIAVTTPSLISKNANCSMFCIVPGGLFNDPTFNESQVMWPPNANYGGADPNSPSHFWFYVNADPSGTPLTIDGWLDDHDRITLEQRDSHVNATTKR